MIYDMHVHTEQCDASVTIHTTRSGKATVIECSPYLSYMKGWTKDEVLYRCRIMGWQVTDFGS